MNINGLSPLMQAAVGGEQQEDRPEPTYEGTDYYGSKEGVLGGQEIAKQNENFELDEENGKLMTTEQFGRKEGILINDPDDILEGRALGDDDYEYTYKVEEDGSYTLTSKKETPEESAPQGAMGGVGDTPMEMASPYKNYRNPQDYKAFNFGNKPTPFNKHKKAGY